MKPSKRTLKIIGIIFAALFVVGLIGSILDPQEEDTTTTAAPSTSSTPVPATTTTEADAKEEATPEPTQDACIEMPAFGKRVITAAVGGTTLNGDTKAIKDPTRNNAWVVAVPFTGEGLQDEVGVFVTNKQDGTGMVMPANGPAEQFWPDFTPASNTDAGAQNLDTIDTAKKCVAD